MELSQSEFQTKLIQLSMKHNGLKKVLEEVHYNFEELDEWTQKMVFKELGITKVYTIKKYIIDKSSKRQR